MCHRDEVWSFKKKYIYFFTLWWNLNNVSGNNPQSCSMFIISFNFKGIRIHIRKLEVDCLAAKHCDGQNTLPHGPYITKLNDLKSIFPILHVLL